MWLLPCFLLGANNMINYNSFDANVDESSFALLTPHILFMTYLGWDMYTMIRKTNLYRTELMIHHVTVLSLYAMGFHFNWHKTGSLFMICESISLCNHVLRNNRKYLHFYRLGCIFGIRMPIWFAHAYAHIHHCAELSFVPRWTFRYGTILFIAYDVVVIYKTLKILSREKTDPIKSRVGISPCSKGE